MTEDFAQMLNGMLDGWSTAMGLRFVSASAERVVAELVVGPTHHQPYGIVHGGVYAGMVESAASAGAGLFGMTIERSIVGLENHTSFLHAVREGTLRITAVPLTRGKTTQVWEGSIADETGRVVATGRVRFLCLEAGRALAGQTVAVKAKPPGRAT